MIKEDFINEITVKTGLTQKQGAAANDVFESTLLAGKI